MDKTFSLRKKRSVRPKISAPQQISAPMPTNGQNGLPNSRTPERPGLPTADSTTSINTRRAPQANANTADYVKRRYSTRPGALPKAFDGHPPVPTMPNLEALQSSRPKAETSTGVSHGKVNVEMRALQDPNLPAEQYVSKILANASDQDIKDYQNELGKLKNRTSNDLQTSVYQNRQQFIKISQEAQGLKSEMRTLRNLMSDLASTLTQTNAALGISTSTARTNANRSSVANLEAMWTSQLQELWRRVEESQKFLPAHPGRHIVHESGRWVELNPATLKPRRRVHMILLNDRLLVAAEKRRPDVVPMQAAEQQGKQGAVPVTLVAEHCLPLLDAEISDISVRPNQQGHPTRRDERAANSLNAITFRIGNESYTFATKSSDGTEKATFLAKYRKALADLQRNPTSAEETATTNANRKHKSSQSFVKNRSPLVNGGHDAASSHRGNMLVEVDGRQQEFRWVENQVDQLDIDIALQRFGPAVDLVEKLRRIVKANKNNALVQSLNEGKVQERSDKLAKAVIRRLEGTNSFLNMTQENISWLTRLGYEQRASEAYLDSRTQAIKDRMRQTLYLGDLHQYLWQVCYIYFSTIKNTVNIYQGCFAAVMGSTCIKWAKERVDELNVILAREMDRLEEGGEERRECLQKAREMGSVLGEVGIDFRHLIGAGFD